MRIFRGSASAVATPFLENEEVDFEAYGRLIDSQIESGMNAIVLCGTTGEAATMSDEEFLSVVEFGVKRVNKRIPILVGVGKNDTKKTVYMANKVEALGVEGLLIVNPYYNKGTQASLIAHYTYIADRVNTPIILYNVPGRTGMSFTAKTYEALSKHKNIVGVKEASGNLTLALQTRYLCGDDFAVYSGNDDQITALMSLGGDGVISVLGNIAPKAVVELTSKFLNGDIIGASKVQIAYSALIDALFMETNPMPVKHALKLLGFGSGVLRLPLIEMSDSGKVVLENEMRKVGLL